MPTSKQMDFYRGSVAMLKMTQPKSKALLIAITLIILSFSVSGNTLTSSCSDQSLQGPSTENLEKAAKNFCLKSIEILASKMSSKDFSQTFSKSSDGQSSDITNEMLSVLVNSKPDNQNLQQDAVKTFKAIASKIATDCKSGINEACQAKLAIQNSQKKLEDEVKKDEADENEQYLKSAEYILEKVCPLKSSLKRHEAILKHENEVQKVSGVSNLQNRHNSGSWVVSLKPKISEWEKAYFQKTKRKLTEKDCVGFNNKAQ